MEKNLTNYSMIRKFPVEPTRPILYVVYNNQMIPGAEQLIKNMCGTHYFEDYVTVVSKSNKVLDHNKYDVYIDPMVHKYMHSWYY
jgi:hypothetical protein